MAFDLPSMDLQSPIDISQVQLAVRKYADVMKPLDMLKAQEVLQHFTPYPGVTDSIELGRVQLGNISKKYSGFFDGNKKLGKIVPRRLVVRPVVAEMADEPERYRRTYITEVMGGLDPMKHPFEPWLIQFGIDLASKDLLEAIMVAKYSANAEDTLVTDSFDGIGTIVEAEKTAGTMSVAKDNVFSTGAISRANAGEVLIDLYRSRPSTFKRKDSILLVSDAVGDLYDDWLEDETSNTQTMDRDSAGQQYLRKSNKRCKIVRLPNLPEGSHFSMLTTRENVVYGFDKPSDFQKMVPFISGNPYWFTAAMKYVIGFQFVTIDGSELCVNDQPLTPPPAPEG